MGFAVVHAARQRRHGTIARIVISGYYGFGNVGDEAVLAGIVESFRAAGSKYELIAISANPSETSTQHGVRAIARSDIRGMLQAIRESDVFLSGGGSLFQDATSARSALYYLAQFFYAAAVAKRPSIVFAQGIGPLRRRWVRGLARRVLNRAALITLRDEQSKDLLDEIGVRRPPIEVTADPSFALPPVGREEGRRFLQKLGIGMNDVAIVVCMRPWGDMEWTAGFADSLTAAAREISGKTVFLALHPGRDLPLARLLVERVPRAALAEQVSTFRDVRAAIGGSDFVISMRLHGLMFAVREGVPSIGISYDPKVEAFCRSCGLPYVSLDEFAPGEMMGRACLAWQDRNRLAASAVARSKELERAAVRNAEMVLGIVEG